MTFSALPCISLSRQTHWSPDSVPIFAVTFLARFCVRLASTDRVFVVAYTVPFSAIDLRQLVEVHTASRHCNQRVREPRREKSRSLAASAVVKLEVL